jgi:hypothetical protein
MSDGVFKIGDIPVYKKLLDLLMIHIVFFVNETNSNQLSSY